MDDSLPAPLETPPAERRESRGRSRSRRRGRGRRKSNWTGRLLAAGGIFVVLLVVAFFGFKVWLKNYIQGPGFRGRLTDEISAKLKARTDIDGLTWDDNAVRISRLNATGHKDAEFSRAVLDDFRADVKLDLFGRAVEVSGANASRLRVAVSEDGRIPTFFEDDFGTAKSSAAKSEGFLDSFKPNKFVIKEARIESVEAVLKMKDVEARLDNLPVMLRPGQSLKEWHVESRPADGRAALLTNVFGGVRLKIANVGARVKPGEVELLNIDGDVERLESRTSGQNNDLARTRFSGSASYHETSGGGNFEFNGLVNDLRLQDWVAEDWTQRLTGTADLKIRGTKQEKSELRADGVFIVKQGLLQGLPVLENLAERTKTLEFTKLRLDTARCDFKITGEQTTLQRIEIEARGMLRIEGYVTLNGKQVSGVLQVGAAPGRLRPIDGAEQRVFTREENGYKWANPPMKLWGSIDDLQEDLSGRIKDAWFDQQIENVTDIASKAPEKAVETGIKAAETGTKLVEEGVRAAPALLDKGAELIQGLFGEGKKKPEPGTKPQP